MTQLLNKHILQSLKETTQVYDSLPQAMLELTNLDWMYVPSETSYNVKRLRLLSHLITFYNYINNFVYRSFS